MLLHFSLNIEINLSSMLADQERISNIELFRSLCAQHMCTSVFALRIDDFFYGDDTLKPNFLALICEMLSCCESSDKREDAPSEIPHSNLKQPPIEMPSEAKSHQPLLSKRSKKQLAKFEAAMASKEQQQIKSGKILCFFFSQKNPKEKQ